MRALVVGVAIAALCIGCDRKGGNPLMQQAAGSAAPTPGSAGSSVETKEKELPGTAAALAEGKMGPLQGKLKPAAEYLPADQVGDKESLLVVGDNWRFQIPRLSKPIDRAGTAAYTVTVNGMTSPANITLWATSEPFTGDLAALAERERKDIAGKGGTTSLDGPVLLDVAGTMANSHAHRVVGKLADNFDMRILAVHDGRAYVFHCETPNVANAWTNMGSECMVRGAAFQVAPPSGPGSKSGAVAAGSAAAPVAPVDPTPTPTTTAPEAPHVLAVGDKVSAQWTNGRWYPGKIAVVNANGTYDIHFNDGDKRKGVSAAQVKYIPPPPPPKTDWKVGDRVQGKWTNGSWYNGKVTAVNPDGTFKVAYDDGDVSNALTAANVRAVPAKTASTAKSSGSSSDAPCPGPGLTRRCNGQCVNIQTNNNHCGGCNNRCPSGKSCDGHMFCRDADGNL